MRILQVHNFYRQPGGEDIVLANEEKLLTRHGHQVFQYAMHNEAIGEMTPAGVALKTIWNAGAHRGVIRQMEKNGIELMHVHNSFPLISPAVYYAANQARVPVVQTLHNYRLLCPAATFFREGKICEDCLGKDIAWPSVVHSCYRQSRGASAVTALMQGLHRAAHTYSSRVNAYIALSEFAKEKFAAGGLPRHKLAVKSNFVMDDPGIGSGNGIGDGKLYALFAGRLAPEKGVLTLLKAWSAASLPIRLKIAGDGPLRGEVQASTKTISGVDHLGQCSHAHTYELMRHAALLVFPSEWYEGWPLSVMEAMACGTPVLAADHAVLKEMVVPGVCGLLFPSGDVAALARALQEVFRDRQYLNGLRYSTRRHYETNFAPEPNYAALMAIYNGVLANGAG